MQPFRDETMQETLDRLAADVLYAPAQDMWVRREDDGTVTVGATHLVARHGQFMLFTPRPPQTVVEEDRSLGVMETAKTAVAVRTPLGGRIVAINQAVVDDVSLVERDPYGAGWLVKLAPTDWEVAQAGLLPSAQYAQWLLPRLAEKTAKPIEFDEFSEDLSIDPHRGY
jgi:glycine cleavage system H protein